MKAWKNISLLLAVILITSNVNAQSISVGHGVELWGQTGYALQLEGEYQSFSLVTISIYQSGIDKLGDRSEPFFFGFFYQPEIDFKYLKASPIVGIFNKRYPNENGQFLHFGFSVSKSIYRNINLYYKHVSNGYMGRTNVGIDTFGIKLDL